MSEYHTYIIGNTTKIGNLEIAENDFFTILKWEVAKNACEELGIGWRLPTIEELRTIFDYCQANEHDLENFANIPIFESISSYWSSTIKKNKDFLEVDIYIYVKDLFYGHEDGGNPKGGKYNVRAVRSI